MGRNKSDKSFEEALKRLEEISNIMEEDDLSLEESLNLFEEGMKLADFCNKKLDEAERKISIIVKGKDDTTFEEGFALKEE